MQHYIGSINEKNGECRYVHTVRFTATDDQDADQRLVSIAATLYGGTNGDEKEGGFYFKNRGAYVFVTPGSWKPIPEAVYTELGGFVSDQ